MSASTFILQPSDLSSFPVAALVDDGSGGYTVIDGEGHTDGTFTIPNVPDGPYFLRVPPQFFGSAAYIRTSASVIDAGFTRQGRPGLMPLTTPTPIVLNMTGLSPWQDGDQIEMFSTEAASWHFLTEQRATAGAPTAGDDHLTDYTFDLSDAWAGTPNVIDGSHTPPDRFVVAQLSTRTTTENVSYQAMTRIFEPAPFTVTPGQAVNLSGAFTDISTNQTLTVDIRGSEFTTLRQEETRPCNVSPADTTGWLFYVLGVAGGLQHGVSGNTADLLALELPRFTSDVTATDMTFGSLPTGNWGYHVSLRFNERCMVQVPGTSNLVFHGISGFASDESLADVSNGGPITPKLGQVRAPKINGLDLYAENTNVGTTPVLSWTAPSVGTPSFYTVTVARYFANGTTGAREVIATFRTDQTSLQIPAGILMQGEYYGFMIEARATSNPDLAVDSHELGTLGAQISHEHSPWRAEFLTSIPPFLKRVFSRAFPRCRRVTERPSSLPRWRTARSRWFRSKKSFCSGWAGRRRSASLRSSRST